MQFYEYENHYADSELWTLMEIIDACKHACWKNSRRHLHDDTKYRRKDRTTTLKRRGSWLSTVA